MLNGLTQEEANQLLKINGYNELPSAKPKKLYDFLIEIIKEPMISLLLATGILYLFLGDKTEAVLLILSIIVVIGISVYQERKSEKSLKALADLSSPRAVVIRDGKEMRIPGREVVVGDLIALSEGDRIPADSKLIEAVNLSTDESLLTGESMSETKDIVDNNRVYSGTMVIRGHGLSKVYATGLNTELGKIGKSLKGIEIQKTPLQREIKIFVKWIAIIGIILCLILTGISIASGVGIIHGILAGLTLAIGILPEEFPIVLLLFLMMGAWRLSKNNVLTRRVAAIETLGATTVLCVDKTGTITKNLMTIKEIYTEDQKTETEKMKETVIRYGILSSQRKPFDPMESAFIIEGKKLFDIGAFYDENILVYEYPLSNDFLCVAHAYQRGEKNFEIALKGAPETVFELCHFVSAKKKKLEFEVECMAKRGLRVIAVAKGNYEGGELPVNRDEINFDFLGLVGLADPVREGVYESVRLANNAGIRIIMITGDFKETALDVALQIGLETKGAITGDDFEKLTDKKRIEIINEVNVFSRVRPNQKLLIVESLKKMGEVVGMTGDGVNDAPALKAADIGIAMGRRGTDVARESAAIVLLDDNFNSIVNGVKMGRRIYDNLQKAVNFLISVHIPIVILSILPVLFGLPLILLPIHIVFLEFIIDPSCTIVFEASREDRDIMDRKPRKLSDRIIAFKNLYGPILAGSIIGALLFIGYYISYFTYGEGVARAFTFLTLVFMILMLIVVNLSKKENFISKLLKNGNTAFFSVIAFTIFAMILAMSVGMIREVFKFEPITLYFWFIALGISIAFLLLTETIKFFKKI